MQKYHWLGGGFWIIPLITFIGGSICMYFAAKISKSGSTVQTQDGIKQSDQNVPITKIGQFWFAVVLYAATVVILLVMHGDR